MQTFYKTFAFIWAAIAYFSIVKFLFGCFDNATTTRLIILFVMFIFATWRCSENLTKIE